MYFVTIDCGTTNSRAYVVDNNGIILSKATKTVGVKDTATTGSRDTLRNGLREIVQLAVEQAGLSIRDISAVLSSGMITSEIGLAEIPHLEAPCGAAELAAAITKVEDTGIVAEEIPVYFVRGIKNKMDTAGKSATGVVGELDFMRGEETQVMGLLDRPDFPLPTTILILSSHTKFIPVDASGMVQGSLTTMSGQTYDAIINHTFVGKSVERAGDSENAPEDYFDPKVVDDAFEWIKKVGLVRALMFPRFLDVLLDTAWYERHLFFEALIAAEDMLAIGQLSMLGDVSPSNFVLVGSPERCRLYHHILMKQYPSASFTEISETQEIDELSIHGILNITRQAGIIQ
jgi:2-dehydro-3-deoxygalactonokinase